MRAEWIDEIGRVHVLEVAAALGLKTQAPRGASGGSCSCPACGAERRHPSRHDPRLAVGVRPEGHGWRCYQCDAHGDQLHLVAHVLERARWDQLTGDRKARVRTWVIEWLRIGESPSSTPEPLRRLELPAPDAPPQYPPHDEVLALWAACVPVTRDDRAVEWLRTRKLNARQLATSDICRVLPWGVPCPAWAGRAALEATEQQPAREAKPWSRSAYRCLFPLYDADGVMRSLLARFVGTPSERRPAKVDAIKSRAAHGYSRKGLVLADGAGVQLLRGEVAGGDDLRVVIAEGEMDLCAWSLAAPRRDERRATLAVVAGSWSPAHAARVPDGATVLVAMDPDPGGQKLDIGVLSSFVERMLAGAIRAERWRS